MEPWQIDSLLVALHNIAAAMGRIALAVCVAAFCFLWRMMADAFRGK